ncbi:MAG: NADPH-dependent FMN reductase [Bacteroidota bacterium]
MKILAVSGSTRPDSSNQLLLKTIGRLVPQHDFRVYTSLDQLPLFTATKEESPFPVAVVDWRNEVQQSDAVFISTPEYLHNLPALLKNALEWLTTSGELYDKKVLPITFTPHPPRGEKAMQSLIWSLQALKVNILGQLDLYQSGVVIQDGQLQLSEDHEELVQAAIRLL